MPARQALACFEREELLPPIQTARATLARLARLTRWATFTPAPRHRGWCSRTTETVPARRGGPRQGTGTSWAFPTFARSRPSTARRNTCHSRYINIATSALGAAGRHVPNASTSIPG